MNPVLRARFSLLVGFLAWITYLQRVRWNWKRYLHRWPTLFIVIIKFNVKSVLVSLKMVQNLVGGEGWGWHQSNTLEGRAAIQRNFSKLEEWANRNVMKFGKGKSKVLHLGRKNCQRQQNRLGKSAPLKRTWGSWQAGRASCVEASSVPWQQRQPTAPWTVFTGAEPGEWRKWWLPPLSTC